MTDAAAAPATAHPVLIKLRRDGVQFVMTIYPDLPSPQTQQHITLMANAPLAVPSNACGSAQEGTISSRPGPDMGLGSAACVRFEPGDRHRYTAAGRGFSAVIRCYQRSFLFAAVMKAISAN